MIRDAATTSSSMPPQQDGHPFRPGVWYKFAQLRRIAVELLGARWADPSLSALMRTQNHKELPWAKSWNEELYPLKIFGGHKSLLDDDEFYWTPEGAADFSIRTGGGAIIKIQCTMAYPEWNTGVGEQGGHTRKLEMIKYNKDGHCYLGGLVSEPRARSPYDDAAACERGLNKALQNKMNPKYAGCHLLIFAPLFEYHSREVGGFEKIITPALEQMAEWRDVFEGLYVCDDFSFVEMKRAG